MAGNS